ncbi:hypothetical protein J6X90_01790 [Candidatus Saccharibacteria bacterium]|nr:hypothetical protein [Candidatus Saccharibacteria bacterium]
MKKEYNINGNIQILVSQDGTVQVSGLKNDCLNTQNIPLSIWEMCKNYRSNDSVVRSGSGLCGVYPFDPKHPVMKNYIESDTLHSTTVEELARNIFRFYPDLFSKPDQDRIIDLLRYHDLGETIDNPDDGSKDHEEKFDEELETFVGKISSLPKTKQEALIRDFIIFENAGLECWSEEDKRIMQFAKLCDKTDAPLGALLYELQDRHGSLLYKKEHFGGITGQDQKYANEIGEFSQAGIWTAHMIDTYMYFEYIEIFIEIIIEACKDVRGFVFPWLWEFCKKRDFSDSLLKKIA